jgi:hypothetical protein
MTLNECRWDQRSFILDINDFSASALGSMVRPITNIVAGVVPRGVLIQGPSLPSTFTVENWNPSGSPPAETTTEYVFSSVPSQRTSPTLISVIGTLTTLILDQYSPPFKLCTLILSECNIVTAGHFRFHRSQAIRCRDPALPTAGDPRDGCLPASLPLDHGGTNDYIFETDSRPA